jgi:hypothetical protein
MSNRERRAKIRAKRLASMAELKRLKESNRRLAAIRPITSRLGDVMCDHGPSPIRSYCVYLMAYMITSAAYNYTEAAEQLKPRWDKRLAELAAVDTWAALEWSSLYSRGVNDALAGRNPELPPPGFPLEALKLT